MESLLQELISCTFGWVGRPLEDGGFSKLRMRRRICLLSFRRWLAEFFYLWLPKRLGGIKSARVSEIMVLPHVWCSNPDHHCQFLRTTVPTSSSTGLDNCRSAPCLPNRTEVEEEPKFRVNQYQLLLTFRKLSPNLLSLTQCNQPLCVTR